MLYILKYIYLKCIYLYIDISKPRKKNILLLTVAQFGLYVVFYVLLDTSSQVLCIL